MGDPTSKSLGVTVLDYNGDGWPDLFVANDTQPNKLYRNNRNGTFNEEGMSAGVAYGEDGVARGAMGVDSADYDRSGRPHLLVGNFSNQMLGLYHNEGNGLFVDEAPLFHRGPRQPALASLSACSSSITTWTATRISSPPTATSKKKSVACSRRSVQEPPLLFRNLGNRQIRKRVSAKWARISPADGRTRRGLRRFRSRWRPGRPDHHQQRTRHTSTATMAATAITGFRFARSGQVEPGWNRRDGHITSASGKQWNMVRSGSSYARRAILHWSSA